MVTRERFINRLREAGYTYKTQSKKGYIWRKGTHRVFVPKSEELEEKYVSSVLEQCRLTPEDIRDFLADCHA